MSNSQTFVWEKAPCTRNDICFASCTSVKTRLSRNARLSFGEHSINRNAYSRKQLDRMTDVARWRDESSASRKWKRPGVDSSWISRRKKGRRDREQQNLVQIRDRLIFELCEFLSRARTGNGGRLIMYMTRCLTGLLHVANVSRSLRTRLRGEDINIIFYYPRARARAMLISIRKCYKLARCNTRARARCVSRERARPCKSQCVAKPRLLIRLIN